MTVFSFRAKNQAVVTQFTALAQRHGVSISDLATHRDFPFAAVEVEFKSDVSLSRLQALATDVGDTSMCGTLRAATRDENSMTFGPVLAFA